MTKTSSKVSAAEQAKKAKEKKDIALDKLKFKLLETFLKRGHPIAGQIVDALDAKLNGGENRHGSRFS